MLEMRTYSRHETRWLLLRESKSCRLWLKSTARKALLCCRLWWDACPELRMASSMRSIRVLLLSASRPRSNSTAFTCWTTTSSRIITRRRAACWAIRVWDCMWTMLYSLLTISWLEITSNTRFFFMERLALFKDRHFCFPFMIFFGKFFFSNLIKCEL